MQLRKIIEQSTDLQEIYWTANIMKEEAGVNL